MEQETRVCKCCGTEQQIGNFVKNVFGYTSVCKTCNSKNRKLAKQKQSQLKQQALDAVNARNLKLSDFTPRELMAELKRRGYDGKITYVETHTIDLSAL